MSAIVNVSFPKDLAFTLKMQDREFADEVKKMAIVKLYELGKISSGRAAQVLEMPRLIFLEMLANYKVSVFGFSNANDLNNDFENA